jgi:hypothetical protein
MTAMPTARTAEDNAEDNGDRIMRVSQGFSIPEELSR